MTELTTRQRLILLAIRDSVEARGFPPSMREIADAVGLTSTSSVMHQLQALVARGYITREPNMPRAIRLIEPDQATGQLRTNLHAEADSVTPAPDGPTQIPHRAMAREGGDR